MSNWRIKTQRMDQSDFATELGLWLHRVYPGVFLFREGPTLSEFRWGNDHDITPSELSQIWIVRLFCLEFEVYARRISYDTDQPWQVRVAAEEHHLDDGCELTELEEQTLVMLGEATGDGEQFSQKPFRFRRAKLRFPGSWQKHNLCGLWTRRFQPENGGAIICWQKLGPVPTEQN